jgi:hypothetical protein
MEQMNQEQMRLDVAMRGHHAKVEHSLLMAILHGYSSRDMSVTDIKINGACKAVTVIQGKNNSLIERIETDLPFAWT